MVALFLSVFVWGFFYVKLQKHNLAGRVLTYWAVVLFCALPFIVRVTKGKQDKTKPSHAKIVTVLNNMNGFNIVLNTVYISETIHFVNVIIFAWFGFEPSKNDHRQEIRKRVGNCWEMLQTELIKICWFCKYCTRFILFPTVAVGRCHKRQTKRKRNNEQIDEKQFDQMIFGQNG